MVLLTKFIDVLKSYEIVARKIIIESMYTKIFSNTLLHNPLSIFLFTSFFDFFLFFFFLFVSFFITLMGCRDQMQ
jgi:hypothetical protein